MRVRILASATRDLIDGFQFYEKQAEGIGAYFIESVFSDIDSLAADAGIRPVYFEKYQRTLARRFPFAIYYRVEQQIVIVYAVLDCRRNPDSLRETLG